MLEAARNFLFIVWSLYCDAGFWMLVAFLIGGFLHVFIPTESFKKWLGSPGLRSIVPATLVGMLLPICSCGVVPLGLSLYWSGASLPAVLAFMAATPLINPAAGLMAVSLFGPFLGAVYVLCGFVIPLFLAYAGRLCLPSLTYAPGFSSSGMKTLTPLGGPFGAPKGGFGAPPIAHRPRFLEKIRRAVLWGVSELGSTVGKYIFYGILLAALLFTLVPQWFVAEYLGRPDALSFGGSVLLGAAMYVCSVGHIPVVAALMALGASPGVAVTFLLSGVATNLPELVSISRLIKPRVAVVYAVGLIIASLAAGVAVNAVLPEGHVPVRAATESDGLVQVARAMDFQPPRLLVELCAGITLALGAWSAGRSVWFGFRKQRSRHAS